MTRPPPIVLNLTLLSSLCLLLWWLQALATLALYPSNMISGWLLLLCLLFLSLLGLRRYIPFLPGGRASHWLWWHYQVGLLSLFLLLLHIDFSLPNGLLEGLLSTMFCLVAGTGLWGWWLYRTLPRRISSSGVPIIFERIPRHRRQLRQQVESLVQQSLLENGSSAIADFYGHHLLPFFQQHYGLRAHLFYNPYGNHRRHRRMQAIYRYLHRNEHPSMEAIEAKVREMERLDFQFYQQGLLKAWLFIHIPIGVSLLIFVALHIIAVYLFYPR